MRPAVHPLISNQQRQNTEQPSRSRIDAYQGNRQTDGGGRVGRRKALAGTAQRTQGQPRPKTAPHAAQEVEVMRPAHARSTSSRRRLPGPIARPSPPRRERPNVAIGRAATSKWRPAARTRPARRFRRSTPDRADIADAPACGSGGTTVPRSSQHGKRQSAQPIRIIATRSSHKRTQPDPTAGDGMLGPTVFGFLKGKCAGPETTDAFCADCIFSPQ